MLSISVSLWSFVRRNIPMISYSSTRHWPIGKFTRIHQSGNKKSGRNYPSGSLQRSWRRFVKSFCLPIDKPRRINDGNISSTFQWKNLCILYFYMHCRHSEQFNLSAQTNNPIDQTEIKWPRTTSLCWHRETLHSLWFAGPDAVDQCSKFNPGHQTRVFTGTHRKWLWFTKSYQRYTGIME